LIFCTNLVLFPWLFTVLIERAGSSVKYRYGSGYGYGYEYGESPRVGGRE
jgi:hypothetical protein